MVISGGVSAVKSEWYIKWVYKFTGFFEGIPLRVRTADHIKSFLITLGIQRKIENWQIDQASEALRILYQHCFKLAWAQEWPNTIKISDELSNNRRQYRDELNAGEVDTVHKEMFRQFRAEMRSRHYSIRTEQSYADWIRRFLIFHDLRQPHELGARSVKEYLEYLAVERQVTASTQNQALNAIVFLFAQVLKKSFG